MDQLQSDLESYRVQLTQIDMCINSSADQDEEMIALRDSIKQLIELTEQQLLENKKQELLSMLPQESPPSSPVTRVEPVSSFNQNRSESSSLQCQSGKKSANDEDEGDDTILVGTKVRAPFSSKVRGTGGATLHNAVITEAFESDVRVVYLNPVELAMVACPFFLEGTCRFSSEKCRYSHGEIVSRKSLQDDFKMPDYGLLKEGQPVLAKRSDSLIWEHATCDIVCENEVLVKFNETLSEGLPFACVHPFATSDTSDHEDAHEEPSEEPTNDRLTNHSEAIIDEDLMVYIDPSADKLGDWEQHTRGIGSKLMQKMGYVFGTGLGPRSQGRVEPVPVCVFPSGKSLDWIADHRDECEAQASSSLQLRKEKKKSSKRKEDSSNMFDLLNVACSSRSSSLTTSKSSSASSASSHSASASGSKPTSSNASPLNVQSVNQDLAIAKMRQEIVRLKESASRQNKAKDPATFKSIQARLEMTQSKLMSMEKRSSSIDKDKMLARERKRLTNF